MTVLFLEGMRGSGVRHWQRWLARELAEEGALYSFPEMPDREHPQLGPWLRRLREVLGFIRSDGPITVLGHSCGSALWLHHAATWEESMPRAERVLLVAPPGPSCGLLAGTGFLPIPLVPEQVAAAATSTRLVVGSDDVYIREGEARHYAEQIGVEIDVIPDAGHLTQDSGFGAWASVREWVRTGATPLTEW